MKTLRIYRLLTAFFLISGLVLIPYTYADNASPVPLTASKSKMSKDQVLQIAQSAIKKHGLKPDDFRSPDVYLGVMKNERSWTVFFRYKGIAIDGDCMVVIDDNSGKYKLIAKH